VHARRSLVSDSLSLDSGRHHFCRKILQGSVVEHGISQKLLQLSSHLVEPCFEI
jgi:hypothetical protein